MGKGDKKTKRGKITAGSYGKTRPKRSSKTAVAAEKEVAAPAKTKAEKPESTDEKPKTTRKKKTEE